MKLFILKHLESTFVSLAKRKSSGGCLQRWISHDKLTIRMCENPRVCWLSLPTKPAGLKVFSESCMGTSPHFTMWNLWDLLLRESGIKKLLLDIHGIPRHRRNTCWEGSVLWAPQKNYWSNTVETLQEVFAWMCRHFGWGVGWEPIHQGGKNLWAAQ